MTLAKIKYCPIKHQGKGDTYKCDEADCAWWNYQVESCAIAVIAIKTGFDVMRE